MLRATTPMKLADLKDTQSEPDFRQIPIDRVGVKGLRFPIQVRDKSHALQSTVATATLTVDLPHHYKGTHMSRFVEVINAHGSVIHVDKIRLILDELLHKLESEQAHAEFEFPFFLEKKAPVTGAPGLVDYLVRFHASKGRLGSDFILTVVVHLTTLCPCSKAISESGAHNQRGRVTLSIRSTEPIWIEDLIRLVESCGSSELYSVLKRPDEKAVTERAYAHPVFVEDLVRNIAARLNSDPNVTAYQVEAENHESIHNHNAYALVQRSWT